MMDREPEQQFILRICWGSFDANGGWHPNEKIAMTKDEQYAENVKNGFINSGGVRNGPRS